MSGTGPAELGPSLPHKKLFYERIIIRKMRNCEIQNKILKAMDFYIQKIPTFTIKLRFCSLFPDCCYVLIFKIVFSEIICIRLFSLIKRLKVLFTWRRGKSDTEREAK